MQSVACCNWAGKGTGLRVLLAGSNKTAFPRRIKRNKELWKNLTKATDVFVKPLQTLIQGRWSSDFRAKTSCLACNNKISRK